MTGLISPKLYSQMSLCSCKLIDLRCLVTMMESCPTHLLNFTAVILQAGVVLTRISSGFDPKSLLFPKTIKHDIRPFYQLVFFSPCCLLYDNFKLFPDENMASVAMHICGPKNTYLLGAAFVVTLYSGNAILSSCGSAMCCQ